MTIAIIGTGWGARVQVPAFRSAGLQVSALAGSNAEKTRQIAHDLQVPFATEAWRAVIARDDVELVSIVTPPALHAEMALAALAAGKHVLCEKPTALNTAEAAQMQAAASQHPNQLALIDHELRFLPALIEARRLIASGAIGRVQRAIMLITSSARGDTTREWNWWSDAAQGGGALGAIGSHQTDTLRYLLHDEVTEVAATLHTMVRERPSPAGPRAVSADDSYSARLRFASGALATLEVTLAARYAEPDSLTILGDAGTLRFTGGKLFQAAANATLTEITPPHRYAAPDGQPGDFPHATVYLAHALRAYLAGDTAAIAPAATFVDGLRIQAVLDAARASHGSHSGFVAVTARD